ncbi:enoyl-CoA hydratase/isomerase family protein [Amycolatopsis sp. GM8]|uniref:enoyl-CoA hydratase/isomerase family protein n=1 Tax=Amycolatopsis sp. GM8 TaxID=2896530 RepID=UPI001F280FF4|nr:enoyl-CoA hydratase/isomerase family protein [Amycolatopsis sp. GM8]
MTRVDHVAVVEFAGGPGNYFTVELLNHIADRLEQAADEGARAAVLTSPGRHFCAGADFSSIGSSVEERGEVADRTYAAGARIFKQPLPVVAAVQGAAIGGGLGLACAADFRVVTPETRLEANFTRLGFHPGFGLSVVLPRLVGPQKALMLLMEGRRVDGREAVGLGLADQLADADGLIDAAIDLAVRLAARAPLAVQAVRATLRRDLIRDVEQAMTWEAAEQRRLWATEDANIGLEAARRRETPNFAGR